MKQRGVTIIELMVSIVIGMGLIGVLLAIFSSSSSGNRFSDAQAEMNEDAQFALQLLARQIQLAGYTAPGEAGPAYALFGCDTGFTNASGSAAAATTNLLTCNAATAPTDNHGLVISYHADRYNTTPHSVNKDAAGNGLPTDCIGNSLALVAGANYAVVENRFFVEPDKKRLSCAGNGGATPFANALPLVENVEGVEFYYGVAGGASNSVTGYRTSNNLGAATVVVNPAMWNRVHAVRICITMRSANKVLSTDSAYYMPCNPSLGSNTPIPIADRYARKTYSMTVTLRNRISNL